MRRLRAALWAMAIGVLSVVVAALLYRLIAAGAIVFVVLLAACVTAMSLLTALVAEVTPAVGAGAGGFGAALVAAVLGLTIALAPLGEGAHRPQLADLLWRPLFALALFVAVCALAGWTGVRLGLCLAHRAG